MLRSKGGDPTDQLFSSISHRPIAWIISSKDPSAWKKPAMSSSFNVGPHGCPASSYGQSCTRRSLYPSPGRFAKMQLKNSRSWWPIGKMLKYHELLFLSAVPICKAHRRSQAVKGGLHQCPDCPDVLENTRAGTRCRRTGDEPAMSVYSDSRVSRSRCISTNFSSLVAAVRKL